MAKVDMQVEVKGANEVLKQLQDIKSLIVEARTLASELASTIASLEINFGDIDVK